MTDISGLVLVGGGGHCRAVIELAATCHRTVLEILDPSLPVGSEVLGAVVSGGDDRILELVQERLAFLITVGHIESPMPRARIAEVLKSVGARCATLIAPSACIAPSAEIGNGTVVMPQAVVGAGAVVGSHCIVNSGAIIEHDAVVGELTHISTGAIVNGGAVIGSSTLVGSHSTVRECTTVGDNCVIGASSFVNRDIAGSSQAYGIPARIRATR